MPSTLPAHAWSVATTSMWLTPDNSSGVVYRSLRIPTPLLSMVNGALVEMLDTWSWEEFGDMSPQDCVDMAQIMVDEFWSGNLMLGMVMAWCGDVANIPDNLLLCDGSTYDRVDYPGLYDVLASAYQDDADTFHTPNLVDNFVMGSASNTEATGGESEHVITVAEMPPHDHDYQEKNEILFPYGTVTPDISARGTLFESARTTSSTGDGDAHNNLPPYVSMAYVIVAR